MTVRERVALAPYTTLGVGGPARWFVEAAVEREGTAAQPAANTRAAARGARRAEVRQSMGRLVT